MIIVKDIVNSLLIVSEKAARIARTCRRDDHLLSLLIEEKKSNEKNSRFLNDFKTLADVLVQELIKYEIGKQFPELKNFLFGEENNSFTNTLGESVIVTLNESKVNTLDLLYKILDGDEKAANTLTETIHSDILMKDVPVTILPNDCLDIVVDDLAMWIDPIDSTTEYIHGGSDDSESVSCSGLNCVTVLIGLFNKTTGSPVIGVINQPFYANINDSWRGRCFWGVSTKDYNFTSASSLTAFVRNEKLIAISSCESYHNKKKLEEAGFKLVSPAGAGYKILCVILNIVDAYVLSQGTTFFWDTCGCQAIIKAQNGNIWNYENALHSNFIEISYKEKTESSNIQHYRNKSGIIACKDENLVKMIINVLQ